MTANAQSPVEESGSTEARYPMFGIVPRSGLGKLFLLWATVNIILALLPVFNVLGNSPEIGVSGMPMTVFYSYVVFTLNCFLGVSYFLARGRAWAALSENTDAGDQK